MMPKRQFLVDGGAVSEKSGTSPNRTQQQTTGGGGWQVGQPSARILLRENPVKNTSFWLVGLGTALAGACGGSDGEPSGGSGKGGSAQSGSGGTTAGSAGSAGKQGKGGKGGRGGSDNPGGDAGDAGNAGYANDAGSGGSSGVGGGSAGTSGGTGGSGNAGDGGNAGSAGEAGGGGEAGAPGPVLQVTLNVHPSQDTRPISPLIYGVNPATATCSDPGAKFALCRLGADERWSAYNWETNAANAGLGRCFQNDAGLGESNVPGAGVTATLTEAIASGAATLVTLPMLDHVAADKLGGSAPPECSGNVTATENYLSTRFVTNRARKGDPFALVPDTSDGQVSQDEFVAFLRDGAAGGTVLFALDTHPALWSEVHEPIHPTPVTYAEVVERNVVYAKAVRDVWPEAEIVGYSGYGWEDFVSLQFAPDAAGNGEFADYYLANLHAASESDGRRLIDYFDIHFYPEVYADSQRIVENGATPALVRARVQATRSLWDESYVEDSWITRDSLNGQPIRLIPRMLGRIATHYPGTKLAIGEWTYGGGNHVSGAVAAADALGAFGRLGVGLAAFRSLTNDDPYVLAAFRMFRNYDGLGAAFGDVSVAASSSDAETASVYASVDSNDPARVVVIAINRADHAVEATLIIDPTSSFATADVYALTQAAAEPVLGAALSASAPNQFVYAMPAYSVSVIVPKP
jgi:hypothetical protein